MKVAVFGGTGFLGSNFVRFALRHGGVEPVVYSTGGDSPSNLSARDVELRLYPVDDPETIVFDDDTESVVNFAHPWERRGTIEGTEQIERFVKLIAAARRRHARLRLIHLSSMSVFEPFRSAYYFSEMDPLRPPHDDSYARAKVLGETAFGALADADRWQLHLRPTVVYGPFCRPWTDRIFEAFRQGNVRYADLSGRIQPVYGEDVSRFIYERLLDFRPGIYNFPGPEEMSWQTFVDTFREIVGIGNLVRVPVAPGNRARTKPGFFERALRKAERTVRPVAASAAEQRRANAKLFAKPFFAEDRLLSDAKWRRDCPTFQLSRLSEVKDVLAEYYRARFPDDRRA